MKKITVMALVAVIAAGSIFAQPARNGNGFGNQNGNNNRQNIEQMQNCPMGFPGPMMGHNNINNNSINDTLIIGIVKSVNLKEGSIKVVNADNREVEVTVTPFTKINIQPENYADRQAKKQKRFENKDFKPDTLQDIAAGSWVKISTFKTDTKALSAAKIAVRNPSAKQDNSNAK